MVEQKRELDLKMKANEEKWSDEKLNLEKEKQQKSIALVKHLIA